MQAVNIRKIDVNLISLSLKNCTAIFVEITNLNQYQLKQRIEYVKKSWKIHSKMIVM